MLGRGVRCPACNSELTLPSGEKWNQLQHSISECRWTVFSPTNERTIVFKNKQELIDAMRSNSVAGGDLCMQHQYAAPIKLRQACDRQFDLLRLYKPEQAYSNRFGMLPALISGFIGAIGLAAVVHPLRATGSAEGTILVLVSTFLVLAVGEAC
jgi:hypothetical protein